VIGSFLLGGWSVPIMVALPLKTGRFWIERSVLVLGKEAPQALFCWLVPRPWNKASILTRICSLQTLPLAMFCCSALDASIAINVLGRPAMNQQNASCWFQIGLWKKD